MRPSLLRRLSLTGGWIRLLPSRSLTQGLTSTPPAAAWWYERCFLRALEARDESTAGRRKQVIISINLQSASNRADSTNHSQLCCPIQCDNILADIEVAVGHEEASSQLFTPSAPCRRALKVAMETVMSESVIFASSKGNSNHFGPREAVEKQCVRRIHRPWVCGQMQAHFAFLPSMVLVTICSLPNVNPLLFPGIAASECQTGYMTTCLVSATPPSEALPSPRVSLHPLLWLTGCMRSLR